MKTTFQEMMRGLDEVDEFLAGKKTGYRVTIPAQVDVRGIRRKLSMTQARFSATFGFSVDAVKHWEGGRRTPESSARAFLTVIERNPDAVIAALHAPQTPGSARANRPDRLPVTMEKDTLKTVAKEKTPRSQRMAG